MKRLMEKMVCLGLVTACRLATWPTRRSPSLVKATTDGVVRPPSALGMTTGSPPSMTATTELVVPRSMPMILEAIAWFSCSLQIRSRWSCSRPRIRRRVEAQPYEGIRLTDVIGALSHALDMAEGQPVGHSVRTAMIGMRIGACARGGRSGAQRPLYRVAPRRPGSSANAAQLTPAGATNDCLGGTPGASAIGPTGRCIAKAFGPRPGRRTELRDKTWQAMRRSGTGHQAGSRTGGDSCRQGRR